MAERYFELSRADQNALLLSMVPLTGRTPTILEKDIWICQVLAILFNLPCHKPMAFKGGTSLSKVFNATERFSEDIDITIDYRSLIDDVPELSDITSNSQRAKLSDQLKLSLIRHVQQSLVPALDSALKSALPDYQLKIELSDDAEKLRIFYPGFNDEGNSYLRPNILIEFGGRNSTLPQQTIAITPDVAEHVSTIVWPTAQVPVLSPMRTFWEKATLIHVECHRPQLRLSAERLSRHWYDLCRLADHEIGQSAINDIKLLKDVLLIKETFYRSGFSNYDRCLTGGLRLIPGAELLDALRLDYPAMLDAQMFYGDQASFDDIIARLALLELAINRNVTASI